MDYSANEFARKSFVTLYTTEQLHFHFSLSCIGEGNGNPLQNSCLENPRDRGVWWAAVYWVAQSRTRLKRLSSSSSSRGFSGGAVIRICLQGRRHGFNPWVRKIPWRSAWQQPTPVFLPGKSHGQRTFEGYSLQLDVTEVTEHALTVHFGIFTFTNQRLRTTTAIYEDILHLHCPWLSCFFVPSFSPLPLPGHI